VLSHGVKEIQHVLKCVRYPQIKKFSTALYPASKCQPRMPLPVEIAKPIQIPQKERDTVESKKTKQKHGEKSQAHKSMQNSVKMNLRSTIIESAIEISSLGTIDEKHERPHALKRQPNNCIHPVGFCL
jgi:hypothetical protein